MTHWLVSRYLVRIWVSVWMGILIGLVAAKGGL